MTLGGSRLVIPNIDLSGLGLPNVRGLFPVVANKPLFGAYLFGNLLGWAPGYDYSGNGRTADLTNVPSADLKANYFSAQSGKYAILPFTPHDVLAVAPTAAITTITIAKQAAAAAIAHVVSASDATPSSGIFDQVRTGANQFQAWTIDGGGNSAAQGVCPAAAQSAWTFFAGKHGAGGNEVYIRNTAIGAAYTLTNGTVRSADVAFPFWIGSGRVAASGGGLDVAAAAIYAGKLTTAELDAVYATLVANIAARGIVV